MNTHVITTCRIFALPCVNRLNWSYVFRINSAWTMIWSKTVNAYFTIIILIFNGLKANIFLCFFSSLPDSKENAGTFPVFRDNGTAFPEFSESTALHPIALRNMLRIKMTPIFWRFLKITLLFLSRRPTTAVVLMTCHFHYAGPDTMKYLFAWCKLCHMTIA